MSQCYIDIRNVKPDLPRYHLLCWPLQQIFEKLLEAGEHDVNEKTVYVHLPQNHYYVTLSKSPNIYTINNDYSLKHQLYCPIQTQLAVWPCKLCLLHRFCKMTAYGSLILVILTVYWLPGCRHHSVWQPVAAQAHVHYYAAANLLPRNQQHSVRQLQAMQSHVHTCTGANLSKSSDGKIYVVEICI